MLRCASALINGLPGCPMAFLALRQGPCSAGGGAFGQKSLQGTWIAPCATGHIVSQQGLLNSLCRQVARAAKVIGKRIKQ